MLCNKREENGVTILEVAEQRIDAMVAPAFKEYLAQVAGEGSTKILLDLAVVDFMDSSGLGAVVSGLKSMAGGELAICNMQMPVKELFKLTRMDRVFKLYDSVEQGIAAMS